MSRGAPAPRRTPAARRPRRRWSLRKRLVVSSVALIAVVRAVIGTVTALALQSFLYAQLDGQVAEVAKRLAAALGGPLAYTLQRVGTPHTGSIVTAGPAVQGAMGGMRGGTGGTGGFPGNRARARRVSRASRAASRAVARASSGNGTASRISSWAEENFGSTTLGGVTVHDLTDPS